MGGKNILVIISAILCLIAFPPVYGGALSIIALTPLLWKLDHTHQRKDAFKIGWIFGTLYMAGFHLWILRVSAFSAFWKILIIWLFFAIYQGIFYGIVTTVSHHFKRKGIPYLLSVPIVWTLGEYSRHLGIFGNSSGALGYCLTPYPSLAIYAQDIGVWGLSMSIVAMNCVLYYALKKRSKTTLYLFSAILAIIFATGQTKLNDTSDTLPISVAIIQGNHTQYEKKTPKNWPKIQDTYIKLTKEIPTKNPTLIVWPETITPFLNLRSNYFRKELTNWSKNNPNHSLLWGTPVKKKNTYYNAVSLVESGKISNNQYHKKRLMPFGEYVPGEKFLQKLGLQSILSGAVYKPGNETDMTLKIQNETLTVGIALCLETIYPKHFKKTNVDIYTVHANNAWFFESSTSAKLLQMSQLRAIENKKPVLHIANTGISAIIAPNGNKLHSSKLNERIILYHPKQPQNNK